MDLEPDHRKILDLLGVKYLLVPGLDIPPAPGFSPLPAEGDDPGMRTFVNEQAFPRAFFVRTYEIFQDPSVFWLVYPVLDLRNTVVLEEAPQLASSATRPGMRGDSDTVEILSYEPNRVVLRTVTTSRHLLVLTDTYDDDWKAFVDGVGTKIYRADYALRAVVVGPGSHEVQFVYDPILLWLGLSVTGGCAVLLAGFWVVRGRREGGKTTS